MATVAFRTRSGELVAFKTRARNPSRKQRARSERKRDDAYRGMVSTGMPSYRSHAAILAAAADDPAWLRQIYSARRKARRLKRGRNPRRGPKRSRVTGRFLRG